MVNVDDNSVTLNLIDHYLIPKIANKKNYRINFKVTREKYSIAFNTANICDNFHDQLI